MMQPSGVEFTGHIQPTGMCQVARWRGDDCAQFLEDMWLEIVTDITSIQDVMLLRNTIERLFQPSEIFPGA